jgi:predicted transcriptional regulator
MTVNKKKFEIAVGNACINYGELAKKSNVSQFTIARMRTGAETNPTTVGKIAKTLGVKVEDLID